MTHYLLWCCSRASGCPIKESNPEGLDADALDAAGAALDEEISDGSQIDYSDSDPDSDSFTNIISWTYPVLLLPCLIDGSSRWGQAEFFIRRV